MVGILVLAFGLSLQAIIPSTNQKLLVHMGLGHVGTYWLAPPLTMFVPMLGRCLPLPRIAHGPLLGWAVVRGSIWPFLQALYWEKHVVRYLLGLLLLRKKLVPLL